MFKKLIKAAALTTAVLTALTFTGCSDTSWVVKVDNITVPSGVYLTYLLTYSQEAASKVGSSSSGSSSSSSPLDTVSSTSSKNSSSSSNTWSQKIEGQTALSWVINQALQSSERLAITEELCSKKNLTLSSSEKSTVSQAASSYMQNTVFSKNGISSSSLQRVLDSSYYQGKLFDTYYGTNGSQAVSDNDLKSYYTQNYVHIKQIFFNKYDDNYNQLSSDKLAQEKAKANEAYAAATADKSKFDSLVKTYNEDPGMTENPDGYTFNKSEDYLQIFKDTAFSMQVGDVKLIESEQGWHVMYKIAVDPNSTSFTNNRESILQSMKSDDFNKILDEAIAKAKVVKNQDAINRYNPQKLSQS